MDRTIRTRKALLAAMLLTGAGQAVMAQDETVPDPQALVRLGLSSAGGALHDEARIHFGLGEPGADVLDLPKAATVPQVPLSIAIEGAGGALLEHNAHGPITSTVLLPLRMHATVPGIYNLAIEDFGSIGGLGCFMLEDNSTGEMFPLWEGSVIEVELNDDTSAPAAYVLHAHVPMEFSFTDALCSSGLGGTSTVRGTGAGPWEMTWVDYEDIVVFHRTQQTGPVTAWDLNAGVWKVIVTGNDGCGMRVHEFTIGVPTEVDATVQVINATCSDSPNGSILVSPTGGTGEYTFHWSNGAQTQDLVGVPAGAYGLSFRDANDCIRNFPHIVVGGPVPIPGDLLAPSSAMAGQPAAFASTAAPDVLRSWDFGDGAGSMHEAPAHTYAHPGTYTVTLRLSEAAVLGCQTVLTTEVAVYGPTGVDAAMGVREDADVRAFTANGNLVVLNGPGGPLEVRVYDAKGSTLGGMHRLPEGTTRWELPTTSWPKGVYVVRATGPNQQWSFSVPVTE